MGAGRAARRGSNLATKALGYAANQKSELRPPATTRMVEIAALGERLSALRLCDAEAITAVRRSLEQYGQLAAVTLFTERDELQIIDGFKQVQAARALGWATVAARSTTSDVA